MPDPAPIADDHQIKPQITRMTDDARVGFKCAGNAALLVRTYGIKGVCTIAARFDLGRDQHITPHGDDIDLARRAFVTSCQDAISLKPQPKLTKHFCLATGPFRPLAV